MVPALSVRALCKRYRPTTAGAWAPITALDDISFDVSLGEAVIIAGPTGAGKTTLARCIAGTTRPTAGRVLWFGTDSRHLTLRTGVALVHQTPLSPTSLTVEDALRYYAAVHGVDAPSHSRTLIDALDRVGLTALRGARIVRLPPSALSKVAIAEALCAGTRLFILDETCTALPHDTMQAIGNVIRGLAADGASFVVLSRERSVLPGLGGRRLTLVGGRLVGANQSTSENSSWKPRRRLLPRGNDGIGERR